MDAVNNTSTSAAEADFLRFRQTRHRYATSPQGPLALVSTTEIDSERTIEGVPGLWAPNPAGGGVRVAFGDRFQIDGTAAVPLRRAGLQTTRGDTRFLLTLTTRLLPWR
jgi:hypothetical protein